MIQIIKFKKYLYDNMYTYTKQYDGMYRKEIAFRVSVVYKQ